MPSRTAPPSRRTRASRASASKTVARRASSGKPRAAGAARAAPLIVNAAGPWVDEVLGPIQHTRLIGGTKGSHIVVPAFPGAPRSGVYVEAGADHRPFFILPWNDLLLIGTTDERYEGDPAAATIDARERAYLIAETERVFPGAAGLAGRVLYTHTGVRPLPHRPRGAEGAITRRHIIRRHRAARGLYSIVGGKLTTHRALAEDVLHKLRRELPRPVDRKLTHARPLPGSLSPADRALLQDELRGKLGEQQAQRLWRIYGRFAADVAALASRPELAAPLGGGPVLAAEVVYAVTTEWAQTLEDLLQRRCMAGLGRGLRLAHGAGRGRGARAPRCMGRCASRARACRLSRARGAARSGPLAARVWRRPAQDERSRTAKMTEAGLAEPGRQTFCSTASNTSVGLSPWRE